MEHSRATADSVRAVEAELTRAEEAIRRARSGLAALRIALAAVPGALPGSQAAGDVADSSSRRPVDAAESARGVTGREASRGSTSFALKDPARADRMFEAAWDSLLASGSVVARSMDGVPEVLERVSELSLRPERYATPELHTQWAIGLIDAAEAALSGFPRSESEFGRLVGQALDQVTGWLTTTGVRRTNLEVGCPLATWRLSHHYIVRRSIVGQGASGTVAAVHLSGWYRPADDSVVRAAEIDVHI